MTWTGGIVLFAVFFFFVLLVILPRGLPTQAEAGDVEPGTPQGAPATIRIWRKFLWSAIASAGLVLVLGLIMHYEVVTLDDLEFLYPEALRARPES